MSLFESDEEAKAAQEIAKAAATAISSAEKTGGFLNKVFGDLLTDSVGIIADQVKHFRIARYHSLQNKTLQRLQEKGINVTQAVPPKIAIPAITQATMEEDDNLQTLWSNLLANAMDPNFRNGINRSYVSIVSDLSPLDAQIFDALYKDHVSFPEHYENSSTFFLIEKVRERFKNIPADEIELSLRNLLRLGCIKPGVLVAKNGIEIGGHAPTFYKDIEAFKLTILGKRLWEAVN